MLILSPSRSHRSRAVPDSVTAGSMGVGEQTRQDQSKILRKKQRRVLSLRGIGGPESRTRPHTLGERRASLMAGYRSERYRPRLFYQRGAPLQGRVVTWRRRSSTTGLPRAWITARSHPWDAGGTHGAPCHQQGGAKVEEEESGSPRSAAHRPWTIAPVETDTALARKYSSKLTKGWAGLFGGGGISKVGLMGEESPGRGRERGNLGCICKPTSRHLGQRSNSTARSQPLSNRTRCISLSFSLIHPIIPDQAAFVHPVPAVLWIASPTILRRLPAHCHALDGRDRQPGGSRYSTGTLCCWGSHARSWPGPVELARPVLRCVNAGGT